MARYSVNNLLGGSEQALAATFKTLVSTGAATGATTLRRGWWDEIDAGQDAAPNATDCPVVWSVDRMTAAGTGTVVVPAPTEVNDAAALLVNTANYTAEPTVTAATSLLALGLNQRQNARWKVFDLAQALVIPAVNLAGLVLRAKSPTYTGTALGHVYCVE